MRDKEILLITKGHPFRAMRSSSVRCVAGLQLDPRRTAGGAGVLRSALAQPYDAFVFYDMPGIRFRRDGPPDFLEPPDRF